VRAQLEAHAAFRAAQRITDAQREELEDLLDELNHSRGSDDLETLMALDARVHRFIYRCAGNPYLEQTLDRYFNLSLRIWHLVLDRLPHLFARVHEHAELLHAIDDGDAKRARRIISDHITTFEREIRGVL
jgi:DNA-binding GntR family transcriptional regulator